MTMRASRRAALAGAAAASIGLAAPRVLAQQKEPIRIGVLTDMSGTYSALTGPGSVLGAQLAVEDFAKSHPTIKVELLSADLRLKPDVALSIAGDWFDNKSVDVVTDVPLSSAAIAIGEMAKAKDKLALFTGAASSILTGERCGPNHLHWAYDTWGIPHAIVGPTVSDGWDTWFFITADYAFGQQLAKDSASFVTAAGGKVLGEARHPFPDTTDFSAFLLQAKASGAKVIGLANGGVDSINCIKQAAEFGLTKSGHKVVGVGLLMNNIVGMGLEAAQGVLLAEPYYWNLNDQTRAFGRRFAARSNGNAMPNSAQAGQYSAVSHYLKAVTAMGPDAAKRSGRAAIEKMRSIPVEDAIFGSSTIRADGRVTHNIYLFEAKRPSETKDPWDVLTLKATVPGDRAFRPLDAGGCPMVRT